MRKTTMSYAKAYEFEEICAFWKQQKDCFTIAIKTCLFAMSI